MQKRPTQPAPHEPVLKSEVLEALRIDRLARLKQKAKVIDATVGLGGHSAEFVSRKIKVLGIDADKKALEVARQVLKEACPTSDHNGEECFELVWDNFRKIEDIARKKSFDKVSGILFDLGVSTPQLTSEDRGFSFQFKEAPLDMRMNPEKQGVTAADLLNSLNETQLTNLFSKVLPKGSSKRLAKEVVSYRRSKPFEKVGDFLEVVGVSVRGKKSIDPATLPFLALRMAVNSELEDLEESLPPALGLLKKGGRMAVISFHSGEDKLVKHFFKDSEEEGLVKLINKRPIEPSEEEIKINPKSRSAKLRILEKL